MGLRLIALLPVVTRTDASSGRNGSKVVPWRRNARLAAPATVTEATQTAVVAAARTGVGVGPRPATSR